MTPKQKEENKEILDQLSEILGPDDLETWLNTPNERFNGLTPAKLLIEEDVDLLFEMLFRLNSGEPC